MSPECNADPISDRSRLGGGWLLLALLGLALLFRCHNLGGESLWLDEGFSYEMASRSLPELLRTVLEIDYNPPTYYLILHGWIQLFGTSETALRLLSVLFSVVAIALLYGIGVTLSRRSVALTAAWLAAIMLFDIRFAQEARAYALLNCLCAASMLSYLRLQIKPTTGWMAVYLAGSALLMYAHPYGVFPVAIQTIHWLILRVRREPGALGWKPGLALLAGLALLFSPWLIHTVTIVGTIQAHPTNLQKPGLEALFAVFRTMAGYHTGFALLLLAVAALAWWPAAREGQPAANGGRRILSARLFVTVWLAAALLLPFVLSHIITPLFASHYLIIGSYPFYLLIAWASIAFRGVGRVGPPVC